MNKKEILILGGTGSLGQTISKILLENYKLHGLRIFSRDEFKQWKMKNDFKNKYNQNVSFILGDVRDKNSLDRAMNRVDIIFNAAAMKHVPACEENPFESVKTNITGAMNIIDCAIDNKIKTVMHISTDKAVYPINLYGATKTVAEKIFIFGNVYTGNHAANFSVCRYGNVIGSRGSIIPLFLEQGKTGKITLTDKEMTRFWISLEQVAKFIIAKAQLAKGGEIYIPKMKSVRIIDIITAMFGDEIKIETIGIREGEKIHECLMTEEESFYSYTNDEYIVINKNLELLKFGYSYLSNKYFEKLKTGYSYVSNKNIFLTIPEIKKEIQRYTS